MALVFPFVSSPVMTNLKNLWCLEVTLAVLYLSNFPYKRTLLSVILINASAYLASSIGDARGCSLRYKRMLSHKDSSKPSANTDLTRLSSQTIPQRIALVHNRFPYSAADMPCFCFYDSNFFLPDNIVVCGVCRQQAADDFDVQRQSLAVKSGCTSLLR